MNEALKGNKKEYISIYLKKVDDKNDDLLFFLNSVSISLNISDKPKLLIHS